MLFPYGTDAPVYHYPLTTIAVIAINTGMFCATGFGAECGLGEPYRWLILEFNQINPLQWVTSAFMHGSWGHLVGNMIFLWCFGLVVEGKIGWQRFAVLYVCLAAADGAIGQIPMYLLDGGAGGALGASGVIFALIAVALIWAPDNDMHCLFTWSLYYIRQIDVRIIYFALFFLALELLRIGLMTTFVGFRMSTPVLHLLGMSVGFPFAIYMLRKGCVDCEGWDVFSRYGTGSPLTIVGRIVAGNSRVSGDNNKAIDEILANPAAYNPPATTSTAPPRPTKSNQSPPPPSNGSPPIDAFCQAIQSDNPAAAISLFRKISLTWGTHVLRASVLAHYAEMLSRHRRHLESLQPLQILVSRRSPLANRARVRIASIQLQVLADAAAAEATLQQMVQPFSESIDRKRRQLLRAIDQRLAAG